MPATAPTQGFDHDMMGIALRLARRGLGTTAPNPSVGAVIVDEATGEVIARGWTQPGGRPHAETEAIRRAGARARGATMFVTLEPCAHHGKTPPCVDAIIEAGLARVVIAFGDPDPRTAGQGIEKLRSAGIEVDVGVCADAARWITLGHILRITERRPFVQAKIALATDGSVHFGHAGHPVVVTGEDARAIGHLLRAEADAILVGHRTVIDDNPRLTCRLPGLERRSPVRVVLAARADHLEKSALASSVRAAPLWVFCGPEAREADLEGLAAQGARVFRVPVTAGKLDLRHVLETLAAEGITRLLVEGGAEVWSAFASAHVVDEIVAFHAGPLDHGDGEAAFAASVRNAVARYLPGFSVAAAEGRPLGPDRMFRWRVNA